MPKGRIRLLSTIPGPRNLEPLVRDFCRRGDYLTAFSDSAVKTLANLVPEGVVVETVLFGALTQKFVSFCGELPHPIAQKGHVVAALGLACEDLTSDSPLYRSAHRIGLHRALADTLHALSDQGLTPEEYEAIADQADPILARKLRSLAALERSATDSLRSLGRSFGREHHRLCMEGTPEKGADLGRILVLAGGDFSPQATELLLWAAKHGAQITVVAYRHPTNNRLFKGARLTAEALNVDPEEVGSAGEIQIRLFADSASTKPDVRCSVVSAADPLAETEWAIRGCLERHASGVRYEKMAIYVRDSEAYAPLIEASAKRLGVPLRIWHRAPLMTNSFARLTKAALEFCASRDVRLLLPLARTTYVGLTHEERTELSVILKSAYSDRANQWQVLQEWVDSQAERYPWLVALLKWREAAVSTPAVLDLWIGRLRDLMVELPAGEETLVGRKRDARALYVLQQSLTAIASVRRLQGPRNLTLQEFLRFASMVWDEADVSVPAGEQGVLVTGQADSLPSLTTLFVVGMLEGIFPRRRSEDPILSDFDLEEMSKIRGGIPLLNSRDRAEAERDEFYCLCAAASEEIVFSYPETDEERDNVPAFYLDEIDRAMGGIERIPRPRKHLTPRIEDCLSISDREIAFALDQEKIATPPLAFEDSETVARFATEQPGGYTPRELRDALLCPFSYFVKEKLQVAPDRLRTRWFSLVRLPQKANLAGAKDEAEAHRQLTAKLEEHVDSMVAEVPDWELSLLRSGGRRLIREWVEREFLSRKLWSKEDQTGPTYFGRDGLRDILPKILKLDGGVGGVSKVGPYSVVHLNETSGPLRSYGPANELTDQDKLYYGLHLLAAWNRAAAIEVETMAGERLLMLLPRLPGVDLPSRVQEGLKVVDLGPDDASGPKAFFDDVKDLAREAVARIERVEVRAIRGDHCAWCDFGELCRQSLEFGEEDSPFAGGV